MSVTDEVSSQMMNKAEEGVKAAIPGTVRALANATTNISNGAVSGIALVFRAPKLTVKAVMSAAGKLRHNPNYSSNNISIQELEKNSDIKKIDEGLTREVMKYFDKGCKRYGITYSAVVDKSDKSNPKSPTYYIFFKGKETAVIEQVMKESYANFMKEQAKPQVSIRAKLAFFRDRVAARDSEQQDLGKDRRNNRADRQR